MTPSDVPLWLILGWLFIFGTVIGSFLNVCIYRIPQHEHLWAQLSGLSNPPSSCPFCKKRILTRDNIPILGWLMLWGRCRFCRHSIPPRYALIEFFNGMLWVVLYIAIVPAGMTAKISDSCLWSQLSPLAANTDPMHFSFMLHVQYFYYLILAEALLVATFIDFDLQLIPDGSTIPAMLLGILGAVVIGNLQPWPLWFQSTSMLNEFAPLWSPAWQRQYPRLHSLAASLAGLVVGGGIIWILRVVGHWIWKREVMGFGDVILLAMIGSFLGWQATIMIFFLAPCCGLAGTFLSLIINRRLSIEIPYGPYLSLAAMLVLLFWRPFFSQFERVFALGPILLAMAVPTMLLMAAFLKLTRAIKIALGFSDEDDYYVDEWRSSDQLAFYANKDYESGKADLKPPEWPGRAAGQGRQFVDQWRNGGR